MLELVTEGYKRRLTIELRTKVEKKKEGKTPCEAHVMVWPSKLTIFFLIGNKGFIKKNVKRKAPLSTHEVYIETFLTYKKKKKYT